MHNYNKSGQDITITLNYFPAFNQNYTTWGHTYNLEKWVGVFNVLDLGLTFSVYCTSVYVNTPNVPLMCASVYNKHNVKHRLDFLKKCEVLVRKEAGRPPTTL